MSRVGRGQKHIRELEEGFQGFIDSEPYRLSLYVHHDKPTQVYVEAFLRVGEARPRVLPWGGAIGDAVHNLRSALDHVVWEITTRRHTPPNPFPDSGRWRGVAFPILRKEDARKMNKALWGVPGGVRTLIEGLQPYKARNTPSKQTTLWLLDELANIDKHRYTNLTVETLSVRSRNVPGHAVTASVLNRPPRHRPKDKTRVAGVIVRRRSRRDTRPITDAEVHAYMDVYLSFELGVFFRPKSPAAGREVRQLLRDFLRTTTVVVRQFKPYLS